MLNYSVKIVSPPEHIFYSNCVREPLTFSILDLTGTIVTDFMGPREVPTWPCSVEMINVVKF